MAPGSLMENLLRWCAGRRRIGRGEDEGGADGMLACVLS
jgi:hypothetical protein